MSPQLEVEGGVLLFMNFVQSNGPIP
jgi:hypothetical protein